MLLRAPSSNLLRRPIAYKSNHGRLLPEPRMTGMWISRLSSKMCLVAVNSYIQGAAVAQSRERQTEDLKVPNSILGLGIFVGQYIGEFGRAYLCSRLSRA